MSTESLQIRPAQPGDMPAYLPLHRAAFAGSMGVELGGRYLTRFLKWFMDNPDTLSLIAEQDGKLAGYVFGAPQGYNTRLNRDLMLTIALATLTHPHMLARSGFLGQFPERVRNLLGKTKPPDPDQPATGEPPKNVFRLVGIGVSPDFRRGGIAQKLIRAYEQAVWTKGYEEIYLSVYEDNAPARALYQNCGWEAVSSNGRVVTYRTIKPVTP